jgi:hypothetical protein
MLPRNLNVIANIWEREKSIRTIVLRPKYTGQFLIPTMRYAIFLILGRFPFSLMP